MISSIKKGKQLILRCNLYFSLKAEFNYIFEGIERFLLT